MSVGLFLTPWRASEFYNLTLIFKMVLNTRKIGFGATYVFPLPFRGVDVKSSMFEIGNND